MTREEAIEKIKKAISKDFHALYVKEFTADWKFQRLWRDLEIDCLPVDNLLKALNWQETDEEIPNIISPSRQD